MPKKDIKLNDLGAIFAGMERRLKTAEYKKALKFLLPKLRKKQTNVFATETDPETGKKWAPLKPATLAKKRRLKQSHKILVATGRMRSSMKTPGHPDNIARLMTTRKPRKTTLFWGTNVPYAKYHMKGTPNMAARPFIVGPSNKDMRAIMRVVTKEYSKKLRGK